MAPVGLEQPCAKWYVAFLQQINVCPQTTAFLLSNRLSSAGRWRGNQTTATPHLRRHDAVRAAKI